MNSNDAVREAANLADRSTFEERAQFVADGDAITLWQWLGSRARGSLYT